MNNFKYMKITTKIRAYKKLVPTPYLVLRDGGVEENISYMIEPTAQVKFMDDMIARFLKVFVKLYASEELSDIDRDKLKRYLDKIIDAKDAVNPREPKGGIYPKKY